MITEILKTGIENAIPGRELCQLLNLNMRELTSTIQRERLKGEPICANSGKNPGFFLAANKREMERYCKSLLSRAGEIHRTRNACKKTIEKLPD